MNRPAAPRIRPTGLSFAAGMIVMIAFFLLTLSLLSTILPRNELFEAIGPQPGEHVLTLAQSATGGLFAGSGQGRVWERRGAAWETVGERDDEAATGITALLAEPQLVAGGADGAWRWNAAAAQWQRLEDGLPEMYRVSALLAEADGAVLLATDQGLYRSEAELTQWQRLPDEGLPESATLYRLYQDGDGRLYAATIGHGLYRLQGAHWQSDSDGLPPASNLFDLIELPDGRQVVATEHGPFQRSGDASWQPLGEAMAGKRVLTLALSSDQGPPLLWAGSDDGLHRLLLEGDGHDWQHAARLAAQVSALSSHEGRLFVAAGHVYDYQSWPGLSGWHFFLTLIFSGLLFYAISRHPRLARVA